MLRPRRALVLLFFATTTLLAGAFAACGGNTTPPSEDDYDAGSRPRDGAVRDRSADGIDLPDGSVCTANPCITQVAVGGEFACAISGDGAVWCWGHDRDGQLGFGTVGDGGVVDPPQVNAPRKVTGLGPVKQLALGFFHACALLTDGTVWCWGYNVDSELAIAKDDLPHPTPVKVQGFPAEVVQIDAGGYHTCARLAGGEVMCWGYNSDGQAGIGNDAAVPSPVATPTTVPTLKNVNEIALADRFTCAIFRDGGANVQCFGANNYGQLGRGATDFAKHPEPAPVQGVAGAVSRIARSGGYHEHVILSDGRIQGWGPNADKEIGLGVATPSSVASATLVPGLTGVVEVAPGAYFTCAHLSDGTVKCWGRNDKGQTGTPPEAGTNVATPTAVPNLSDVKQIGCGLRDFACALTNGGQVSCWGSNVNGQLGRGDDRAFDPTPAPITFP